MYVENIMKTKGELVNGIIHKITNGVTDKVGKSLRYRRN